MQDCDDIVRSDSGQDLEFNMTTGTTESQKWDQNMTTGITEWRKRDKKRAVNST